MTDTLLIVLEQLLILLGCLIVLLLITSIIIAFINKIKNRKQIKELEKLRNEVINELIRGIKDNIERYCEKNEKKKK